MDSVLSELIEQVAAARAAGESLRIQGGGTRAFYGEPWAHPETQTVLNLSPYAGVVTYEPSELVVTARTGTPLVAIEDLLAEHHQMLAFEPPRFGVGGTLGGCIAAGLAGPRRLAAGSVADFVLGTRLLTAEGKVLRFGGEVMKNVAGYDISRLLVGSLGILGALVEVSIKVLPRPRQEATLVLELGEAQALDHYQQWRARPVPVSATTWLADPTGSGRLFIRLSGNESAVRQASVQIGGEALPQPQADDFWLSLRDQTHPFFQQRPLWRIVLPSGVPALDNGPTLHEWQGGLRWLPGEHDAPALRARVRALGGWAGLYRRDGAPDGIPSFHPVASGILKIHQRLKHEFDPTGVFNPGRLIPEI